MAEIKSVTGTKSSDFLGTGRRKTAVARVRLASGTGKIVVNGRAFENYFPLESLRATATQPLTLTGLADKYDARITVSGGGPNGQAGAVRHSLARALLTVDANLSFMAKYANYAGSGAAFGGFADKSVFWLQTAYKY